MKTPISYYGGKQQLVSTILPLIPVHTLYSEPFFGGGAIFFAKEPSKVEVINDINKNVINFYKVAKRQFKQLQAEIDITLHSEEQYKQARQIYLKSSEEEQTDVLRAWALFVLSHQTFLNILDNSWKYSKSRNVATGFNNKKKMFDETYVQRLENTQIFCRDALRVISNVDSEEAFHFIDPPYYNSDMGHYGGYSLEDFKNLLKACETIKGRFLLTSYPSEVLDEFAERNGWHQIKKEMHKASAAKAGEKKIEVITMNYMPSKDALDSIK